LGRELPNVPIVPKIWEGLLPVTRARMFWISRLGLKKKAPRPVATLNSLKLWKRLAPRIAPHQSRQY
jgi:hypothetical protein